MSHDYTFISDLNNGGGMPMQHSHTNGMPMQGMPMQHPHTNGMPMQGMPMQHSHTNMQGGLDQFDMLKKYLSEAAEDSDSDSDSDDSDSEEVTGNVGDNNWQHFYGISSLIILAIILYYVFKIRKELVSMYEEA